jgi:hypothetical protein
MAAARVGGTGPSGQLSLRGCSQATVATFDPSTLIRAGCHEADVDAQLGRIGVEKWAVYQPQAQLCKTAGCANHAARGNYRCCALCRQGWWPLDPNYYAGRPRALEWRSQYLLFSMYVRAGFSQRHLQVMFQVKSCATVSDYISTWAVFLYFVLYCVLRTSTVMYYSTTSTAL